MAIERHSITNLKDVHGRKTQIVTFVELLVKLRSGIKKKKALSSCSASRNCVPLNPALVGQWDTNVSLFFVIVF